MKKFPWAGLGIGCIAVVVLVIARCAVTAGRVIYYGGTDWMNKIVSDPWFYVGMAAAAVCAAAFAVLAYQAKKEAEYDGCE